MRSLISMRSAFFAFLVFCLIAILLPAPAFGQTYYLESDPNPGVQYIIVVINDVEQPVEPAAADGSVYHALPDFDPAGPKMVFTAKASFDGEVWSELSDPLFKGKPDSHTGLRVSSEP
jgi:hypothetical protein